MIETVGRVHRVSEKYVGGVGGGVGRGMGGVEGGKERCVGRGVGDCTGMG